MMKVKVARVVPIQAEGGRHMLIDHYEVEGVWIGKNGEIRLYPFGAPSYPIEPLSDVEWVEATTYDGATAADAIR